VRDVVERAVSDRSRQTGMVVAVTLEGVPEQVGLSTKIALYRATQELLSNAFRHGNGAAVRLRLESDGQFLQLTVVDDGPGFDVATLADETGLGLAGMREQAELLGGDFEIRSQPGSGTETRVRWPLTRGRGAPALPADGGDA
jgi:signal transduction histidine kinase